MRQSTKRIQFPAWLYVVLVLIFDELIFQVWTGAALTVTRVVTMVLFTVSFGLLLSLLTTIGRSALISRIVAIVLTVLFAAIYFAEFLMHDAYAGEGGYMSLGIIFGTAGAAGADFRDTILDAVWAELWRLLLLILPGVLYGLFGAMRHWGKAPSWLTRGLIAVMCVVTLGLGYLSALCFPDAEKYEKKFDFVESVNIFGLMTAFRLDLRNAERELDFHVEIPDLDEPETTEPTAGTDEPGEPSEPGESGEEATEETLSEKLMHPTKQFNNLNLDFAALAESESNSEVAKLHSYVASQRPSTTNPYTGLFKGKNLIIIAAESYSKEFIDPELTPALYRLSTKGIEFTDFYQPVWGGSTSTGEFSILTGLVPTNANAIQDTIGKNMYFTMGNRLVAEGYNSFGYHNNTYDYYHRDKTHKNLLGCSVWMGMGNGMEQGVKKSWPESDKEMIEYTMDLYLDQEPFCVYYMTVSGHGLYSRMGNYMSSKNYDAVADLDVPEVIKCYIASNLELEYGLESLLERLEKEGKMDDTVIVLTADHYPYCLEQSTTWGTDRDYLSEYYGEEVTDCFVRDHNSLIIWSGYIEDMNIKVDTPTYSLDILPTLLNLFGVEYDSRLLVGRDVFSNASPLVIWNTYSWMTDLGTYNSSTKTFTAKEGVTVDEDYVSKINGIVSNKISYSRGVIQYDYYERLFG